MNTASGIVKMKLPVTVVTGFLGSGKTTLLNHLLKHASLKNSLVIINEFGEVGIDHLLVSAPTENMRLLANGCLCCEVRGDLVGTLTDVLVKRAKGETPPFDRILIETTGLADPVPIVQTVVTDTDLSPLCRLDRVVGVIDAVHALTQLSEHAEVCKQIAVSDVLLLTKTDLVTPETRSGVEDAAKHINKGAEIIPVLYGEIDPAVLFCQNVNEQRYRDLDRWLGVGTKHNMSGNSGRAYLSHTADIRTFTLYYEAPVTAAGLATWLSMLAAFKGAHLLRVKGIVNVSGNPYIVHAVQTVIHEPVLLEQWPTDDRRTRIVFIVRGIERRAVEDTFFAFAMSESLGKKLHIDPAAYAHFVEAAKRFIVAR